MKENTELEWQFSAAHLRQAREWLAAQPCDHGERRLASRPTLELIDTYYDSPDWMIFRAGFALRVRRERADDSAREETEVTLKSLHDPHGGLAKRKEISQRVGGADLDTVLSDQSGIGERVRELIGPRQLNPLFKASTRRERRHLLEADSDLPLAEVDIDETSIETPSGATCELRRVEVECINATPAALEPFVERLREAAQLCPVEKSKFRAGLDAAGLDPARKPVSPDVAITATQSFADTQFALLRKYLTSVLENEPKVRAGSVAAVHEMRVAARHLDVLLRLFAGFGPRWAVGSRRALRSLVDSLGSVRDCDVQLAYLQASGDSVEPLQLRIDQQRGKARARLLRLLDSSRYRGWVEHWIEQLELGTGSGARARQAKTAVVAQTLIRSAARKLRKHADRLTSQSSADDYHKVRIRAKRLRYTLDAFGALYGEAASEYLRVLGKLQDLLGEFHDSAVRSEQFGGLVTRGRGMPASTSFLVGRWVERDQRAFDDCRRKFPKLYRRTQRRRWRELSEGMRRQTEVAVRS